jgi:hypothetical protein
MGPLRHGEGAEVKTLVVGAVEAPNVEAERAPADARSAKEGRTRALASCSRLADAESFGRLAVGALHRRGVECVGQVAAVSDGAEWIPGVGDLPCPPALRIRDCAPAAQRLAALGEVLAPADPTWRPAQLHRLQQAGPEPLLADRRPPVAMQPSVPRFRSSAAIWSSGSPNGSPPPSHRTAGRLAVAAWRVPTSWSSRRVGRGRACDFVRTKVHPLLALRNAVGTARWEELGAQGAADRRPRPRPRSPRPRSPRQPAPPPPATVQPWRRYPACLPANL